MSQIIHFPFNGPATATAEQFTQGGLICPGFVGVNAQVPDSVPLSITGDIDVRVKAQIVNWNSGTNFGGLIGKDNISTQRSWGFYVSGSGIVFEVFQTGTGSPTASMSGTIPAQAANATLWVRATFATATGIINLYYSTDGTTWVNIGASGAIGVTTIFDSTTPVTIGQRSPTDLNFTGIIYRAQIMSGVGGTLVLDADFTSKAVGTISFVESSSQAATVTITGPVVADMSGVYHNGLAFNGVTFGALGKYAGGAVLFDGVNDYIRIPIFTYPAQFSFSCWVNYSGGAVARVITNNHSSTNGFTLFINTTGQIVGQVFSAATPFQTTPAAIAAGSYKHVVMTYDAVNIRVYVDNVLVGGPTAGTLGVSNQDMLIGANDPSTPSNLFVGNIDEFKMFSHALSVAEISALFTSKPVFVRRAKVTNA
jgi:hypothetical protein